MTQSYEDFLFAKRMRDPATGIAAHDKLSLPKVFYELQVVLTRWALMRGRAAIFAGTGLGKTGIEEAWSDKVVRHTNRPVLMFAPLAVGYQHIEQAEFFGLDVKPARSMADIKKPGIYVSNYGRAHLFDFSALGGLVLDESSILKSHDGATRQLLTEASANIPFRLAATATPAPNDFMELGNHSEFLGVMTFSQMLAMFFTHDGGETQKWRLKGHAQDAFWQWVASWAVMLRKPSDLGLSDEGYELPPLIQKQHWVQPKERVLFSGGGFVQRARSLQDRIKARRMTVKERAEFAAGLVEKKKPFVLWCNLNSESDLLKKLVPDALEIRGGDPDEVKEERLKAFSSGEALHLISKPSMTGFGLNWQHCRDTAFVGLTDSYEQVYQAVRRFWRFGQSEEVTAHFIASELEGNVVANFKRKEADADRMAEAMVRSMASISKKELRGQRRDEAAYKPQQVKLPSFMVGDKE